MHVVKQNKMQENKKTKNKKKQKRPDEYPMKNRWTIFEKQGSGQCRTDENPMKTDDTKNAKIQLFLTFVFQKFMFLLKHIKKHKQKQKKTWTT